MLHPNLVRLYELFADDAQWFFSMELVRGVPFDQDVRAPAFDPVRLREALYQTEDALSAISSLSPLTLEELLEERIRELPSSTRALLEVCAVAARPLALDLAAAAAGSEDPAAAMNRLRVDRLIRVAPHGAELCAELRIEPYHDRVRGAVIAQLSPDEGQDLENLSFSKERGSRDARARGACAPRGGGDAWTEERDDRDLAMDEAIRVAEGTIHVVPMWRWAIEWALVESEHVS